MRPFYLVHNIPGNCADDHLSGEDPLMLCGTVVGLELTGQGVWLDIPCTWAIRQGEVKAIKEQRPSGLTGVQPFGRLDVLKVLVVCPYNKRMFCPLQPVPLLLESQLESQ